jgi:AcrR family transcriptional regulator
MLDTATQTAGKIDPRVKRTRKLIVDAFVSLQAEKSFDDITIQDITARATVNRATFYAHFPDKYALLDSLIRDGFGHTLHARLGARTDTTPEHLRQLFLAVTDYLSSIETRCRRSYQMFESLVEAQVKRQLCEQVRAWLEAQPRARAQPSRRLEIAATLMSWALYGAALEWRKQGGGQSAESFADEVLPLIAPTVTALGA